MHQNRNNSLIKFAVPLLVVADSSGWHFDHHQPSSWKYHHFLYRKKVGTKYLEQPENACCYSNCAQVLCNQSPSMISQASQNQTQDMCSDCGDVGRVISKK